MIKKIVRTGFIGVTSVLLATLSTAWGENDESSIATAEPFILRAEINVQAPAASVSHQSFSNTERHVNIDDQIRTIGGANDLAQGYAKTMPSEKFPFVLNSRNVKDIPELTIGYVRGINTPEAHAMGQSNTQFVSSPAVIKVNGVRVQYLYEDGQLIKLRIPKSALKTNGFNILQIEAGYYFLPDNRVAYDQIELQNIALSY